MIVTFSQGDLFSYSFACNYRNWCFLNNFHVMNIVGYKKKQKQILRSIHHVKAFYNMHLISQLSVSTFLVPDPSILES